MNLSDAFVSSIAIRSNYGIIRYLSLLQNSVMKLPLMIFKYASRQCAVSGNVWKIKSICFGKNWWEACLRRTSSTFMIFMHAVRIPCRYRSVLRFLLRNFIELLYNGEYIRNRDLDFYASRLCITPHYLSEICKKVSGKPATYWIDRFTLQEITRLLRQKSCL